MISEADILFNKLNYNKMVERYEDLIIISYSLRLTTGKYYYDRVIEFSNQTGLNIRNRTKSDNIFLRKDELNAIMLKIAELEKDNWSFR